MSWNTGCKTTLLLLLLLWFEVLLGFCDTDVGVLLLIDMATRPCQQWSGDYTGWLASSSVTSHCSAPGCHGCTSILYVPTHEPVQLRFNTFQLSSSEYVEIRDGATSAGLLIGRFTSTHRPGRVVEVAGNKIFIVFSSDTFHSFRRAFNLTFQPKGTFLTILTLY